MLFQEFLAMNPACFVLLSEHEGLFVFGFLFLILTASFYSQIFHFRASFMWFLNDDLLGEDDHIQVLLLPIRLLLLLILVPILFSQ